MEMHCRACTRNYIQLLYALDTIADELESLSTPIHVFLVVHKISVRVHTGIVSSFRMRQVATVRTWPPAIMIIVVSVASGSMYGIHVDEQGGHVLMRSLQDKPRAIVRMPHTHVFVCRYASMCVCLHSNMGVLASKMFTEF
jgi:hypothetical protein